MPKVTAATVAVTALLLIGLSGCAASAGNASDEPAERPAAAPEEPAPLVAEAPEAIAGEGEENAVFLEIVRGELLPGSGITNASDEQLIAAGHDGCEQVRAGVPLEEIRLVEGEEPTSTGYFMDTSAIFFGAQQVFCPETIQNLD